MDITILWERCTQEHFEVEIHQIVVVEANNYQQEVKSVKISIAPRFKNDFPRQSLEVLNQAL